MLGPALRTEKKWIEWPVIILLVVLALLLRVVVICRFPTIPRSDFSNLLELAKMLAGLVHDHGWGPWNLFNAGMPSLLSLVLRVCRFLHLSDDPIAVARTSTALLTGLLPLIPMLLLRGALPLWSRALCGLGLALWPDQIFSSGVLSQDNWVLVPTISLGCLLLRAVRLSRGYPIWAALLLALTGYIRQEMLVVLAPVAVVAACGWPLRLRRGLAQFVTVLCVCLLLISAQRWHVGQKFSPFTQHGGISMLGSYVPGAADGWLIPRPFVETAYPEAIKDPELLSRRAVSIAVHEALRRPFFHSVRMFSVLAAATTRSDALHWSMLVEGMLPTGVAQPTEGQTRWMVGVMTIHILGLHSAFLAVLAIALWQRNLAILVLAVAIGLKVAIHGVLVAVPRYFIATEAIEILVVGSGLALLSPRSWRLAATGSATGIGLMLLILAAAEQAKGYVRNHDEETIGYHMQLDEHRGGTYAPRLHCVVSRGIVTSVSDFTRAGGYDWLRLWWPKQFPKAGEQIGLTCDVTSWNERSPLEIEITDDCGRWGSRGCIVQQVWIDDVRIDEYDIGDGPFAGWRLISIPASALLPPTTHRLRIAAVAAHCDRTQVWGNIGGFRLRVKESR
jgi:hypothetical protein